MIAASAVLASAREAQAYVVKKTSGGEFVHWETPDVHYTLDAALEANVTGANAAAKHAMEDWGGSVGAPDLFVAAPSAAAPTKPAFDQKNGVFYMPHGYQPAGRALAITILTYENRSGRILDADVVFNGAYKFEVLPEKQTIERGATNHTDTHPATTDGIAHDSEATSVDTVYDLHHVIAHELGHSLGMNDEMDRRDALMYRYSAPNDTSIRTPAPDDIAGLAELYSTRLEAKGNGCGNATVAPKKPGLASSYAAMLASLALLAFLVLRAKKSKRARLAFVVATAAAAVGLLPSAGKNNGEARASTLAAGHARATVTEASTSIENGLFKTAYKLTTESCRTNKCPEVGHGAVWGGTIGNITQEVGGQFAPQTGDKVDVSFEKLPSAIAPLTKPLAGRDRVIDEDVRVLTSAK